MQRSSQYTSLLVPALRVHPAGGESGGGAGGGGRTPGAVRGAAAGEREGAGRPGAVPAARDRQEGVGGPGAPRAGGSPHAGDGAAQGQFAELFVSVFLVPFIILGSLDSYTF